MTTLSKTASKAFIFHQLKRLNPRFLNSDSIKFRALFCIVALVLINPATLAAKNNFVFERLWPRVNPDWYFYRPLGIATDDKDFVYIADALGNRVVKLNSAGHLITHWGKAGNEDGQFSYPKSIAIDDTGLIYVADSSNNRVQRFDKNGKFIDKFGAYGSGPGQFSFPGGMAFDSLGNMYVADSGNHRIQKFDSSMQFVTAWGSEGSGDGQFLNPDFIAIDSKDNVYVGERDSYPNYSVQKFTADGDFITKWGPAAGVYEAYKDFNWYTSIAVDPDDNIIVAWRPSIDKFTPDGQLISTWPSTSGHSNNYPGGGGEFVYSKGSYYIGGYEGITKFTDQGQLLEWWSAAALNYDDAKFHLPMGLATDSGGNTYVADFIHVAKLSPSGEFLAKKMAHPYSSPGVYPQDVAVSPTGELYVSIREFYGKHHVQVRTADGELIKIWGTGGTGEGEIDLPSGIALDSDDNVYLVNKYSHRIQKFDKDGNFIRQWGSQGHGGGQFMHPTGIATDSHNDVYVADSYNNRIQKFTPDGSFIHAWGNYGTGDGELNCPVAIEIGPHGNIYVVEKDNHRFQKFSPNGVFISKGGTYGTGPGQMRDPMGIAVDDATSRVFVSDHGNHRIQVFKEVGVSPNKAIIVAGGGPYPGNTLWSATQMCANHAYRTLAYQGFTKESIHYLTSDTDLDLDYNGVLDDVDGDATRINLQQAITNWASDADNVVIYLVDHGGNETFRLNPTETLGASDLDAWLDETQFSIPGKLTLIMDACSSGSLVPKLSPPAGKERLIIASASQGESAYFLSQGAVSFSNYFWTNIFNGASVKEAFDLSTISIGITTSDQHPVLDDNGNGAVNEAGDGALAGNTFIGDGIATPVEAPVVGGISPAQSITGINSATLYAEDVSDADGIARVWATVRPPDYMQDRAYNAIEELPAFDLLPMGNNRWEAVWDHFDIPGTFHISIYARDRAGSTSVPQITTVNVNNPLNRKAIIVAASWQSDKLWPAIQKSALMAYDALRFQGYTEDDLYVMCDQGIPGVVIDGPATRENFFDVLGNWAADDTQDIALYMVVNGNKKRFRINQTESITAEEIDILLDTLQSSMPGKAVVIYDACRSGSFLESLLPPEGKERILIASTSSDKPAFFLSNGEVSFSSFFWPQIMNGADLHRAFVNAERAMWNLSHGAQAASLDDNSNGIGNEITDGRIARNHALGVGIMLAGDAPLIGSVTSEQFLTGQTTAAFWARDVTTTGTLDRVWTVITPPQSVQFFPDLPVTDLPQVTLEYNGSSNRWEGLYSAFSVKGTYAVNFYAMDTQGNLSEPTTTTVMQTVGTDAYEEDDTFSLAYPITINAIEAQQHHFHDSGDQDWIQFFGIAGESYEIKTQNLGTACDTVITLYEEDGTTEIVSVDDSLDYGEDEILSWQCPADGVYYVKIEQYDSVNYGDNTEYDLRVYQPVGGAAGTLVGRITDQAGNGIGGALIKIDGVNMVAISLPDGSFLMILPAGTYAITAQIPGYPVATHSDITITSENYISLDYEFDVIYPGDINADGNVDMVDIVTTMKVLSGLDSTGLIRIDYTSSGVDINGNSAIGLEEVVYILQKVSGLR